MTWDTAPWVVKGARHSAEVGRLLAYVSGRSNEGIIEPTDLKVIPQATPGNRVRVSPGAALIRNRYAGGDQQSYAARNPTEDLTPVIVTTGGSARSDLIVARVEDPQYGAATPTSPLDAPYVFTRVIQGVPAGTTSAKALNLNYPAIALARLDLPASGSSPVITAAMIKDVRKIANPRRDNDSGIYYPAAATMSKTAYASWPFTTGSIVSVAVPEWATQITIKCNISGAIVTGAGGQLQAAGIRTVFDGVADQHQALQGFGGFRQFVQVIGKHQISAAQRGTTKGIQVQGWHTEGSGTFQADSQSTIALEWEFTEAAA